MLFDWLLRHPARVGLLGALLGLVVIACGAHFHIGMWIIDGPWAYVGSAIAGAVAAVVIWYVVRKEYGWP